MKEFDIYSKGICFSSVCSSLPLEETEKLLNLENPTGIDSKWKLSKENFRTGEDNPCVCERNPATHKHYLFEC